FVASGSPGNIVTTDAGSGATGAADGPVATATFTTPYDVSVSPNGGYFVADANYTRRVEAGQVSSFIQVGSPLAVSAINDTDFWVARDGGVWKDYIDTGNNNTRTIAQYVQQEDVSDVVTLADG